MRRLSKVGVPIALAALVFVVCGGLAAGVVASGENPVPYVNALSPVAVVTGGPDFTLTVDGVGFVEGSEVHWDGEARPTTFESTGRLTAQISAADIAADATVVVTVVNPSPGGGESPPVDFVVGPANPVPGIGGLSPSQAMVGDPAFSITVIGSDFVPGSTVLWNGEERATGFVNSLMLSASVRATDLVQAGTAYVSVVNPPPGGGQSVSAGVFTIVYPVPAVTSLDPASVWAGGPGFTLAVAGSRFMTSSVVQIAGIDVPTTFVSSERLDARVPAEAIAHSGAVNVRVFTPSPGGGLSVPVTLDVVDDSTPPVTSVEGLTGLWHRSATVFTLVATDVGRGVLGTFWRLDSVADFTPSTRVRVPAPRDHSFDGMHTVEYFSNDVVLNFEPYNHVDVGIDTRPPATAIAAASVKKGGLLRPRYRIDDVLSKRAQDAALRIVDAKGRAVARYDLGRPATRAWRTGTGLVITLPKGSYKMVVLAHDLAGNPQGSVKSARLVVN